VSNTKLRRAMAHKLVDPCHRKALPFLFLGITAGLFLSGCSKGEVTLRELEAQEYADVALSDPSLDGFRRPNATNTTSGKEGSSGGLLSFFTGSLRGEEDNDATARSGRAEAAAKAQAANYDNITIGADGVQLDFQATPMAQFLEQMVGGALNLNYVLPPTLPGTVTFRTSKPLNRDELFSLVKNILASKGLAIRPYNDVYYVASPDALKNLGETLQAGGNSDQQLRMVPVGSSDARKVAEFIRPMLPSNLQIIPAPANGVLFVRAGQSEIAQVTELVQLVSASDMGNQDVRIIPLGDSSPSEVATTITKLYAGRGENNFTIVPLASRSAILVSSSDRQLLAGLSSMVRQLDVSLRSSWELRIIRLQNIPAKFAAEQLTAAFGGKGGGSQASSGQASSGNQPARPQKAAANSSSPYGGLAGISPQLVASPPKASIDSEDGLTLEGQPPRVAMPSARTRNANGNGSSSTEQPPTSTSIATGGNEEQKVTITPDERNNSLMLYSDFATYKKVQTVLQQMDVQQSQVVIEATVLEVELNDNLSYGVNWYLQNSVSGAKANLFGGVTNNAFAPSDEAKLSLPSGAGPGGALTFSNVVGVNAVKTVVTALQGVTKVKVISSPYLTVVDGKEASLQIGQEVPFATANLTAQNGAISQTITTKKTGIILKVTPKINGDDSVMLTVEQEVSSPDLSANGGTLTPVIATRNIKSDVLAHSGSTVALGGLIQNKLNRATTGLPVASRIPVVGELFKQTTDNITKTELLVLITTRVSRTNTEISQITNALRRRTSTQ